MSIPTYYGATGYLMVKHSDHLMFVEQLRAENEALRIANTFLLSDAQRHRWLRANGYDMGSFHREHEHNAKAWFESLDDSAIDAAIAEEAKP